MCVCSQDTDECMRTCINTSGLRSRVPEVLSAVFLP